MNRNFIRNCDIIDGRNKSLTTRFTYIAVDFLLHKILYSFGAKTEALGLLIYGLVSLSGSTLMSSVFAFYDYGIGA